MTRFQVITEKSDGKTVYLLRDMESGALARVIPEMGANCMELTLCPGSDQAPVAVINDMPFLEKLKSQPSRYGIPILFPWPSGIPDGAFQFEDRVIRLNEPGEDKSRHHGFVNTAAWRVVRSDCDDTGAWVTCAIDSADCGELAAKYPSQFTLEITWKLGDDDFQMQMAATNTGSANMPFGLGLHPYFTVPFGAGGSRQQCRLAANVAKQWDLDVIVPLKAGSPAPASVMLTKPTFVIDPGHGTALGDTSFNHVYQAKFDNSKQTHASVIDPANALQLTVAASQDFGTWVFYSPPDRKAISLEPWTLAPNGFNLAAAGVSEAGMKTLQPAGKWSGQVSFSCHRIARTT